MATAAKKPTPTQQLKALREELQNTKNLLWAAEAEYQQKLAKGATENYGLGYDQGQIQAAYEFSRLNWLERLRYKP